MGEVGAALLYLCCNPAVGSKMKAILLASLFFILTTTVSKTESNNFVTIAPNSKYAPSAWWTRVEFHPFGVEVRGIPVGKIRATWCKATEFRKDLFPPGTEADLDDSSGFSFAVDGFFDGSKTRQTALVGAYEACTGQKGLFLLVLAWPQGRAPVIRFVGEGHAGFAILWASTGSTIKVYYCMGCDFFTELKWDKSKRGFVPLPQEPY